MKELSNIELKQIYGGGGVSAALLKVIGVIAGIVFGIGVIDGYVRPLKCH